MDPQDIRLLIQRRLQSGRLPHGRTERIWGGAGDGQMCDGCGTIITTGNMAMQGRASKGGGRPIQFHLPCFQIWDDVRRVA
ncbi:MAG: hypothetical protein DMD96_02900 [Candidatus Rokuibacteriota bacterium]|nr:MAG: hypothetical protein DMD96_02900 [Candidatus Rokubacteria bacterium]